MNVLRAYAWEITHGVGTVAAVLAVWAGSKVIG